MTRLVLVAVLALGACTDDTDLSGIYEITLDVASAPCGTDAPVTGAPGFVKFHKESFFGQSYFVYDQCNDAAATDCPAMGSLFNGLPEAIDHGWQGRASSSSPSNGQCFLSYDLQTATLNGSYLTIEHSVYSDVVTLAEADCTTDEAEKRGTMLLCKQHIRIEASKR